MKEFRGRTVKAVHVQKDEATVKAIGEWLVGLDRHGRRNDEKE
ncbi:hypothetical protein JOJ87_001405 [Rhodococcus ruber]|nr:hypothetical protein [Rhodococcus ruber]MBP2211061.1 hypothetical protein [Rhodococcus ruber]